MKRIALVAFVLFSLVASANAQLTTIGAGGKSGGGASFQGSGDIASGAIGFWSCGRAYNAAYATGLNAACDVVDTATGLTTCTLHFLSTGFVNTTECNATACATACSVTKMYDQTGNGNHVVQATLANMPGLTFSAQNGLPCPQGSGSALLKTAGNVSQAAPFSITGIGERTGAFTSTSFLQTNGAAVTGTLGWTTSANTVSTSNGAAVTLTAADSAFHALLAVSSGTAPLFAVDSSANTSTSSNGTTALSSTVSLMNRPTLGRGVTGLVCEAGIWPSDLNSVYQSMLSNMRSSVNGWNF